jgi:hypothetical protein
MDTTITATIRKGGEEVSRTVNFHKRSTGELIATAESDGDGYLSCEIPEDDEYYVVILDDLEAQPFVNATALDHVST